MKNTTIEFNDGSADPIAGASPWASPAKGLFKDLILKPEFAFRRFKFPVGQTWFRIVPAMKQSEKGWLLGVHALQYKNGRHAHPKTLSAGEKSVFDHAYSWAKKHKDEALFSKSNKDGYRLLTDPVFLCWMLVEENGKTVARLLLASGYDGSRGGVPGIGHQIWQLSQELDEDGHRIGNPGDPELGTQIRVEKKQTPGARYPSYTLKRGRIPVPVDEMIAKMDPDEMMALTPLEKVIHLPSEEDEWQLLENVIDPDTVREIRNSIG